MAASESPVAQQGDACEQMDGGHSGYSAGRTGQAGGPESQTRTRSGRDLCLTRTILNFIPRTVVSHWDTINNWVCGSVTIKS